MTDTTDPVEAVAEAIARGQGASGLATFYPGPRARILADAEAAIAALTALGAVMPDEAAKLRAGQCDALCRDVEQDRDALRAELDALKAEHENWRNLLALRAAALSTAWEYRKALREQVADALALCTETRPDSVIGTSDTERLKAVRDRLAMKAGGGV